jgi:hypothetical protein
MTSLELFAIGPGSTKEVCLIKNIERTSETFYQFCNVASTNPEMVVGIKRGGQRKD